jgi:hypothetical protein
MGITEKIIKKGSKYRTNLFSGIVAITKVKNPIDVKIKIQLALIKLDF